MGLGIRCWAGRCKLVIRKISSERIKVIWPDTGILSYGRCRASKVQEGVHNDRSVEFSEPGCGLETDMMSNEGKMCPYTNPKYWVQRREVYLVSVLDLSGLFRKLELSPLFGAIDFETKAPDFISSYAIRNSGPPLGRSGLSARGLLPLVFELVVDFFVRLLGVLGLV
ncbi:hypothetical protein PM082_006181 [Marasmius tenuissimus]|nr:hypothetical protein PM082_006181 [Marasmius tenuissimus]